MFLNFLRQVRHHFLSEAVTAFLDTSQRKANIVVNSVEDAKTRNTDRPILSVLPQYHHSDNNNNTSQTPSCDDEAQQLETYGRPQGFVKG